MKLAVILKGGVNDSGERLLIIKRLNNTHLPSKTLPTKFMDVHYQRNNTDNDAPISPLPLVL